MGRRSTQGFLIELAIVGALAGGAFVEKKTEISGLYVILPALALLVPLFFYNYMRPYRWRSKQQKRYSGSKWPQPESRWAGWRMHALVGIFMVATFCAISFWPTDSALKAAAEISPGEFSCQVSDVHDGDTLRCTDGTRVRLHAIASREADETCSVGHPCPAASAASATAKLRQLADGQNLICQQTGTSFKRVTAICRNESNIEINCAMVKSGTVLVWPKFNQQRAICE